MPPALLSAFALALLLVLSALPALSQPRIQPDLRVRVGALSTHGIQRDGTAHRGNQSLAARLQVGATARVAPRFSLGARLAMRMATDATEPLRLRAPNYTPGSEGSVPNDIVLERLVATWHPSDAAEVHLGRFQSDHGLPSVAKKSLLRLDNSGFAVNWNDGLAARADVRGLGRLHAEISRTTSRGVVTALRAPLRFDDGGALLFAGWSGREPIGLLTHRAVQVLVHPNAVPDAEDALGPLVAVAAQAGLGVPLPEGRFLLAAEGGWTPTAPSRALVRVPGSDEAGAFAGQVTANWTGLGGGDHDIGLVLAAAGSGWLTSSSIRPNNIEQEARYYWRFTDGWRLDFRVRRRQDLVAPLGAERRRSELDAYVRLNVRL